VRLRVVRDDALKGLVTSAYRYVNSAKPQTPARGARRRASAPSRRRS
jgi:hypothetical protein